MQNKGTKTLETDRLILRRFCLDDAEDMFDNWASDAEVTRFLTWPPHADVGVTKALLSDWIGRYSDPAWYSWAIELKETGEVIGNISVVKLDEKTEAAEIGYCMGKAWWGRAIMPEALRAVIAYLFDEVCLNRVAAGHDSNNQKSGRVMDKAGMKFEGVLRAAGKNNQGICDEVCHSVLREEWLKDCAVDTPSDCGFTRGSNWFRYRVGAIIVEAGCVLLAGNKIEDYFYSVGGGVHMNETAEDAVKREVFEETGVQYEIDRLAVIHENFFDGKGGTLADRHCHEIAFYYLMKPRGTKELRSNSFTYGVKEEMHWIPIEKLGEYKAFPSFLQDYLNNPQEGIVHIVTDERQG